MEVVREFAEDQHLIERLFYLKVAPFATVSQPWPWGSFRGFVPRTGTLFTELASCWKRWYQIEEPRLAFLFFILMMYQSLQYFILSYKNAYKSFVILLESEVKSYF